MKYHVPLIVAGFALTACVVASETSFYTYRPNTTNAQKAQDSLDCEVESVNRVSANQQVATTPVYRTPTYVTPMTTTCYGYSCTTTGGQIQGGQVFGGQVYSYDANQQLRSEVQAQCLQRKGYTLVTAPVCAESQTPKGLSVSMSDKVQPPPQGKFCIALLTNRVGVPVAVK